MKKIEETFYSYATGNIYYTIQKNYNEVKSSTSLVCAVFQFSEIEYAKYPASFSRPPVFIGVPEGDGCYFTLHHPSSKKDLSLKASIIEDRNES